MSETEILYWDAQNIEMVNLYQFQLFLQLEVATNILAQGLPNIPAVAENSPGRNAPAWNKPALGSKVCLFSESFFWLLLAIGSLKLWNTISLYWRHFIAREWDLLHNKMT